MLRKVTIVKNSPGSCWEYKGKRYATFSGTAIIDDDTEPTALEFADVALEEALGLDDPEKGYSDEKQYIDDHIYGYVDSDIVDRPVAEVAAWIERNLD